MRDPDFKPIAIADQLGHTSLTCPHDQGHHWFRAQLGTKQPRQQLNQTGENHREAEQDFHQEGHNPATTKSVLKQSANF